MFAELAIIVIVCVPLAIGITKACEAFDDWLFQRHLDRVWIKRPKGE